MTTLFYQPIFKGPQEFTEEDNINHKISTAHWLVNDVNNVTGISSKSCTFRAISLNWNAQALHQLLELSLVKLASLLSKAKEISYSKVFLQRGYIPCNLPPEVLQRTFPCRTA